MTVLELMIVLAIIGGGVRARALGLPHDHQGGSRRELDRARGGDARTSQLAIEHGRAASRRVRPRQAALRGRGLPGLDDAPAQRAAAARRRGARRRAREGQAAAPGQYRPRRSPAAIRRRRRSARSRSRASTSPTRVRRRSTDAISGDATARAGSRRCAPTRGIKFKEIWVQHRDDSVDQGPGRDLLLPARLVGEGGRRGHRRRRDLHVLVYGLTGRVELKDGVLRDVNDHMLRNVMGDKDAERDGEERDSDARDRSASRLHAARGDDRRSRCSGSRSSC